MNKRAFLRFLGLAPAAVAVNKAAGHIPEPPKLGVYPDHGVVFYGVEPGTQVWVTNYALVAATSREIYFPLEPGDYIFSFIHKDFAHIRLDLTVPPGGMRFPIYQTPDRIYSV